MTRLILFLIRRKLGLKKWQFFRFANQKSSDTYYFGDYYLVKVIGGGFPSIRNTERSGVSLNWLLDKDCELVKYDCYEFERGDIVESTEIPR